MNIENQRLTGGRLVLPSEPISHGLGPNLRLDGCDVESACSANGVIYAGVTMVGGTFKQKTALRNVHFGRVHFKDVRFLGKFAGCTFGEWESEGRASVEDCDFSEAKVDGCRFLNCNVDSLTFPRWPYFTLVRPNEAAEQVQSRIWPGRLRYVAEALVDYPPACVAICMDAAALAKKNAMTADEVRQAFVGLPGLRIAD